VAQIVPFVVLGLAMGLVTIWWERHEQGTQGKHFMLSLPERLIVASHAVWFYASKLIWPANLAFSYPRWTIDPANPFAYLWLVAGAGVATAIYFARRYLGRSVEVAALFYVATLSPLLGFIMLYTFRYTFVADHYQYMAVIGPIALIAAGISIALRTSQKPFLKPIVYALILGTLFLLTGQQCGMYKDLETLWRTTLRRNPDSWMAHSNLGAILLDRGEIKEALPHFEKALELQPDDKVALNNLGQIHLQRGKVDEAIACYRKALADDPNYTTAHNNLAVALLQKGEASEALVHLQRVQKKLPNSADIHRLVGMALLQNGQLKEAMAEFQKSLDLQPATETHDQLGNALFQAGRTEEATAQFEKSLEMNPDDKVAHQNLGIILVQKGKVDEAIGHFKKAVASDPNYALGQATLGKVLSKTGKLQEAIPHLERAVEIQPRNPDAHFNLGAALWQAGEISRAIVQYQQAIDLQPNFPEAYSSLATAAWTLATSSNSSIRNPARSIELAEKADLFFNRKNPAVARILAAVYAEAGRFPEAIETGQRALDLSLGSDPLLTVRLQGEIQSYRTNAPLTRSLGISERKPTPVTNDR
jgi:Tfp pilus assembly protein PilF